MSLGIFSRFFRYVAAAGASGAEAVHHALSAVSPGIYVASASALVMDADTGDIVYGKSENRPMYPASTTKVMTALLICEYAKTHGWNENVAMSENAVRSIGQGASNIGLCPGESLSLKDCLYAIMLASANEVCVGVAEHIAGSADDFAVMMNKRARSLGCLCTAFANPHGLPDKRHITTALDIALIMRGAIREPAFTEAISCAARAVCPNNGKGPARLLMNKNRLIQEGPYRRSYVVGGKTGYTFAARHTLVNYAVKDGARLICVTMRAPNYMTYTDTISLFDYGFARHRNELRKDTRTEIYT
jgi:D-alanyl-D-alanine carboxypeptidase